jgi:hypothetical protein
MSADVVCKKRNQLEKSGKTCMWFLVVPWSLTSMMASLLGELVDRRSSERTSRVMRGSVAIVTEDMARLWQLEDCRLYC